MLLKQLMLGAVLGMLILSSCNRHTSESLQTARGVEKCGIIVRLTDRSDKIDDLRKRGLNNQADLIEKHDREENRESMDLFSNACSFTEVYFIFRSDTEAFLENQNAGVLLDNKLQRSDELNIDCDRFYFIEKGDINKENEIQRANDWVVKDQELKPVSRPFPWRVNYPLDCVGRGKKTEIDCLCFKIEKYIEKSY